MCGSEGTLGIITEATLRLDPLPDVRGVVLLFFERLDSAAKAAIEIGREEIAACDMMDRRLLEIVRDADAANAALIRARGSHAAGRNARSDPAAVRARLNQLVQRMQRRGRSAVSYCLTTDRNERIGYGALHGE
ncbi:MAG: FAD-linked oxidase C-terminal domain-containing protein [Pirellulales bacterium]